MNKNIKTITTDQFVLEDIEKRHYHWNNEFGRFKINGHEDEFKYLTVSLPKDYEDSTFIRIHYTDGIKWAYYEFCGVNNDKKIFSIPVKIDTNVVFKTITFDYQVYDKKRYEFDPKYKLIDFEEKVSQIKEGLVQLKDDQKGIDYGKSNF